MPHIRSALAVFEQLEPRLMLSGTSYVVNSLADTVANDSVVTLREAIEAANSNTAVTGDVLAGSSIEVDTITFDQAALQAQAGASNPLVIRLAGAELSITDDLDIQGLGSDVLRIDAYGLSRAMAIGSEAVVELSGLMMTGGHVPFEPGTILGGAIQNNGTLSLVNSRISGNMILSGYGGGIYNGPFATLTITNSVIDNNSAGEGYGGGIANSSSGTLSITETTITNNAAASGGGIDNRGGTLEIADSVISANRATYYRGSGGGIRGYGAITLSNTTLSDNRSELDSGGLNASSYDGGVVLVKNCVTVHRVSCRTQNNPIALAVKSCYTMGDG